MDSPLPIQSPDGCFEVFVDEFWDRGSPEYTTRVKVRETGEVIFSCQGTPPTAFDSAGLLIVQYPGYQPDGIELDPVRRVMRTGKSDEWLPLSAWPPIERAFGRGWAASWDYRQEQVETGSNWVEAALFGGSLAVVLLLAKFAGLMEWKMRMVLLAVASLGVLFFGWLWLNSIRHAHRLRALRNPRRN